MQLKSIKANGFKSFADKIEIDIKDGITGIVGPNGSGKSNIVDAVKWVLGEQSVKALRGANAMSDVIFQGSLTRKPMTRASVALVFDNEDHYLNSEFKELEIKRTVYQSGENEYTINGSKVRLKDITDLFLDSGAGREAFSIISQGKIGEILNSKPEERRVIIEEAAGVLKYKKRKVESLKKLEKTNDNLSKVDLIINELSVNLDPLREQAEKAKMYESFKNELESIEISLLINDITNLNKEYEEANKLANDLRSEIESIESINTKDDARSEKLKLELLKIEQEININSSKLLDITESISSLEAEKQVITERQKYEVDDVKLANNIITLKESILEIESNVKILSDEISSEKDKLQELVSKRESILNDNKKYITSKNNLVSEINLKNRLIGEVRNKIEITTNNIESSALIPTSVKAVLDNPRLKGLHGTLGSLITFDTKYTSAMDTVLGFNQNVIVCDNEVCAKDTINFLKDNHLGRATFFPLNVIKPKYVDLDTLNKVRAHNGFVSVASDLVTYDTKYKDVVLNQLGNIIVVNNIDDMNEVGKLINYSYRVVTLDGDILHTGGSITGGEKKSSKNILNEKANLEKLNNDLNRMLSDLEYNTKKLDEINNELEVSDNNLREVEVSIAKLSEEIRSKDVTLASLNANLTSKKSELDGTENLKGGTLQKELDKILKEYYKKIEEKNTTSYLLDKLKNTKSDLNSEIAEIDLQNRKANSEYNKKVNDLKDIEVKLGKLDIKLDNLLLRLNDEYQITYERAKVTYEVPDDIEKSRGKVNSLKRQIKELGEVNIGAISEFERINTRYEFLSKQKADLKASIDDLLAVIDEMDTTMEREFTETFNKVNKEFEVVFRRLFKGGHGELVLTEPLNILETGIDIIAEPPGKKLKNITLLSGGEKTLTAIALLFAILNVKVVPFCILDEVEAALDEANVDEFGKYLKEYEHKTQFIIITHKKKTMEYANNLYGITMQESGVSKLVSVKLEGIQ